MNEVDSDTDREPVRLLCAAACRLEEHAGNFPVLRQHVVGPFDAHINAGRQTGNGVGSRQRRHEGKLGSLAGTPLWAEKKGCRQISLRRLPSSPASATACRLAVGDDPNWPLLAGPGEPASLLVG